MRDIWEYHSNVLLLINTYQNDFRENNKKLIDKEKEIRLFIRDKKTKIDLNDLKLFCKNEWKELIIKAISEIKTIGFIYNNDIIFIMAKNETRQFLERKAKVEQAALLQNSLLLQNYEFCS